MRGAQGFYGIDADLVTYGKVIGGGFPLGVVAGRAALMDAIDGGMWNFGDDSYPAANQTFFAGTFCKHPVAMAAACAVLRHLREQGPELDEALNARAARLVAALRKVIAEEQVGITIPHCASLFHFRFDPPERFGDLLFYAMVERGIYTWEGRGCFLSTAHTDADCDRFVEAFRESIHAVREGGFLPRKSAPVAEPRPSAAPLPRASFPLTPAQRQIWVHAALEDDASRAYNEESRVGLNGRFDLDALRAAVHDVMVHHEALRTVFDAAGETQHVLSSVPIDIRVHTDPSGSARPGRELARSLRDQRWEIFDLSAGPLFRVHVHPRGPDRQLVQIVHHHLVADALGTQILWRDLQNAYAARRAGNIPQLPKAMQFSEYASLFAAHSNAYAEKEAEWVASFEHATPLLLPTDRPRPLFPTTAGAKATLTIPAPLAAKLRDSGRREGRTLVMTLLGGMLVALHRIANQPDIVVGITSAGRPFPGSDSMVGHCVDLLPIRSRIGEHTALRAFLQDVRGWLLEAYEHEVFSLARLADNLKVRPRSFLRSSPSY